MKKVLVVNVCQEKLHYYEFVKPIEDILSGKGVSFFIRHYKEIKEGDLNGTDKVIICGTSLKDNDFVKSINYFDWIKSFDGKILGICAGMQILGLVYGGEMYKKIEIGFYNENFEKEFLRLKGEQEIYHLHNNFINFSKVKDFEIVCKNKNVSQAVKHKVKEIYGVLFHPEVRNKEIILSFVELK